jgi:hypothetical protein
MTWQHEVLLAWLFADFVRTWMYAGRGYLNRTPGYLIAVLILMVPSLWLFFAGNEGPMTWQDWTWVSLEAAGLATIVHRLASGKYEHEDFGAGAAIFTTLFLLFGAYLLVSG